VTAHLSRRSLQRPSSESYRRMAADAAAPPPRSSTAPNESPPKAAPKVKYSDDLFSRSSPTLSPVAGCSSSQDSTARSQAHALQSYAGPGTTLPVPATTGKNATAAATEVAEEPQRAGQVADAAARVRLDLLKAMKASMGRIIDTFRRIDKDRR
jgi:hypothetical protein